MNLNNYTFNSSTLPAPWCEVLLTDICHPKQWKTIPISKLTDRGYVVYGANGKIGFFTEYSHEKPTLMITCRGATCGNLHISEPFAYINGNAMALDSLPDKLVLLRYLYYALKDRGFEDAISGSAQPQITRQSLMHIKVRIAPLAEQKQIAAKLDELLAQVDAIKARIDAIPGILKLFRQSVLVAALSGRLTEEWRGGEQTEASMNTPDGFPLLPSSWRWGALVSVCEKIVDCLHSTPKWTKAGKLCVRTTNFKPGNLDLSEVRFVSESTFNNRIKRLRPKPGDVLYSREGGILGIACMVPPKVELCLGQRMMLFRTKNEFSAKLLMSWLNSPFILYRVKELTGGSASPHLNIRDIKSFPVPIPPIAEQSEIINRIDQLFTFADNIEQRVKEAQNRVNQLTQSILAKAFRGDLTAEWREQNPHLTTGENSAEALLNRIKAERVAKAPKKKTRKRSAKPKTEKV